MKDFVDNADNFGKDYFVNSKISNYEDYRKRKFDQLAQDLIHTLNFTKDIRITDFGCGTGGLLLCLKNRGMIYLKGTDISMFAITYGIESYKLKKELDFFNLNLLTEEVDYTFFLDVLEHVPNTNTIKEYLNLSKSLRMVVRIPVSKVEGEPYFFEVSRNDKTHVQCHTKEWWTKLFRECGFVVETILNTKSIFDSDGVMAVVLKRRN